MGDVLRFIRTVTQSGYWTSQEKAELFRLAGTLSDDDGEIETASGLSDAGDPWFVVYHAGTGDTLVHVARINGKFVVHELSNDLLIEGDDLRRLLNRAVGHGGGEVVSFGQNALVLSALALVVEFYLSTESDASAAPADPDWQALAPTSENPFVVLEPPAGPLTETATERPHAASRPLVIPTLLTGDAAPPLSGTAEKMASPPSPNAESVVTKAAAPALAAVAVVFLAGREIDDHLTGTDGDDVIAGGNGNDVIRGDGGNDLLLGGQGDDTLVGGVGNDSLIGGDGDDTLFLDDQDVATGGTGADHFVVSDTVINTWVEQGANGTLVNTTDRITDFNAGEGDRLSTGASGWTIGEIDTSSGEFSVTSIGPGSSSLINLDTDGDGTPDLFLVMTGSIGLSDTTTLSVNAVGLGTEMSTSPLSQPDATTTTFPGTTLSGVDTGYWG